MNLLLTPAQWRDYESMESPPITWNPDHRRYEILISSPEAGSAGLWIEHINPVVGSGHTIEFEYNFSSLDPNGFIDPYLAIIENGGTVLSSVNLSKFPQGTLEAEVTEGNNYTIMLTSASDSYYSANFFSIDGIIDPLGDAPYVPKVLPWWLCIATPPSEDPPIVRDDPSITFVPFAEYDADFRYPLASSRVASKIKNEVGCIVCGPNLIDIVEPEPEPEPEPETPPAVYIAFGEGTYVYEFGLDPGFSRLQPIIVSQNNVQIAMLDYSTHSSFDTWNGSFSEFNQSQPITFSQSGWECDRLVETDFFFIYARTPQLYPVQSYRSSDLEMAGGDISSDFAFEIEYDNTVHEIYRTIIGGSYTWIYPSDFPVGIVGEPASFTQFGNPLSDNCFLWSEVLIPLLTSYDGVMDAWNQSLDVNGFNHTEQEAVTLTRGSDTYEGTRIGTLGNYQYNFSPTPPSIDDDPEDVWSMTWPGGSCNVRWTNNII